MNATVLPDFFGPFACSKVEWTTVTDDSGQPFRRILVFGGTFDPPHRAHALLPAQAARLLSCDLILYVPAALNPLKTAHPTASAQDRMAMLVLAVADVPNARISTVEIDRAGPSYMIDTLRALRKEYAPAKAHAAPAGAVAAAASAQQARVGGSPRSPSATAESETDVDSSPEFQLLIGCDQALDFHRWKDWQEILMLATPAVMLRPPWNEKSYHAALQARYTAVETESWMNWTLRLPMMDTSATEIRKRLHENDDAGLRELLDPAVLEYIRRNGLYR